MNEDFINIFINGLMTYIKHIPNIDAEIGTPYLVENKTPRFFDITGIIDVSGQQEGCVYFTSPRVFLSHMLILMGENNVSENNLLDLSGEIANTISGNARSSFGKNFSISTPVIVEGAPSNISIPEKNHPFVIPITWQTYTSLLIVSLNAH